MPERVSYEQADHSESDLGKQVREHIGEGLWDVLMTLRRRAEDWEQQEPERALPFRRAIDLLDPEGGGDA